MIARGAEMLRRARAEGWAVAAFTVHNLEQAIGVCQAAEETELPVILQAGSSGFRYAGMSPLAALALASAAEARAAVGVHLDHSTDPDEIRRCLEMGYSSVMFDGSALSLDENIRGTRAAVREAAACGAWVEGELAGFAGEEDESSACAEPSSLTDPGDAERFMAETGADALAVAVGNVHGIPAHPARLDLDRLAAIAERVEAPLVLHGASGLDEQQLRAAVELGVAKLNVNAELRRAYREGLTAAAARPPAGDAFAPLLEPVIGRVADAAREKLLAFGPARAARGAAGGR